MSTILSQACHADRFDAICGRRSSRVLRLVRNTLGPGAGEGTTVSVQDASAIAALPSRVFDAVICDELCLSCVWRDRETVAALLAQVFRVLKYGGVACGLYPSGEAVLAMAGVAGAPLRVLARSTRPAPFGARWTGADEDPEYYVFDVVFKEMVAHSGLVLDTFESNCFGENPVSCVTLFGLRKPSA